MANLFPSVTAFAYLTRPEIAPDFGTLFYTIDAANSPLVSKVPAAAEELTAQGGCESVWLQWKDTRRDDASGFKVLRSTDGKSFSVIADLNNYTRKSYRDQTVEPGNTYYYKVVLYNRAGNAQPSETVEAYVPEDTYFDAAQSDGAWAGIDLGEERAARVTKISYCPRQNLPQRMTGGRFQAADNPSFTDAVTLHTVSGTPATSVFTSVSVDCPEPYRYLRYIFQSHILGCSDHRRRAVFELCQDYLS